MAGWLVSLDGGKRWGLVERVVGGCDAVAGAIAGGVGDWEVCARLDRLGMVRGLVTWLAWSVRGVC